MPSLIALEMRTSHFPGNDRPNILKTGLFYNLLYDDFMQGDIKVTKPLDREVESHYIFPILVRDGGFPERTAFAAVSLRLCLFL